MTTRTEGLFSVGDGKPYKGVSYGDKWNGWECPFFTCHVAQEIAKDTNEENMGVTITYDEKRHHFEISDSHYPNDVPEVVLPNNEGLFGIGAFNWCWEIDALVNLGYEVQQALYEWNRQNGIVYRMPFFATAAEAVMKVLNNRTCQNCNHYEDGECMRMCTSIGEMNYYQRVELDFGCNQWEAKK